MNNKGFTTVEVLVCFVVVSVVMMSLFSTISAFNEKKIQETYRSKVYEFKNSLTNTIQQDLIKRGLSYAKITDNNYSPGDDVGKKYTVDLTFRDGIQKRLIVYQRFTKTAYRIEGTRNQDDTFYIEYGVPADNTAGLTPDMIRYELPNLGETKGHYNLATNTYVPAYSDGKCYENADGTGAEVANCLVAKDFQINNIAISITNEADPEIESHVLNIYIGFYHSNLGTKYAINIVAPIDYQTSSVDQQGSFPTSASDPSSQTAIYYPVGE